MYVIWPVLMWYACSSTCDCVWCNQGHSTPDWLIARLAARAVRLPLFGYLHKESSYTMFVPRASGDYLQKTFLQAFCMNGFRGSQTKLSEHVSAWKSWKMPLVMLPLGWINPSYWLPCWDKSQRKCIVGNLSSVFNIWTSKWSFGCTGHFEWVVSLLSGVVKCSDRTGMSSYVA